MSVLDRLEREVREARRRREEAAEAQLRHSNAAMARAAPAVARARRYLETLAGHLNELEPALTAGYDLDDIGELANLQQGRYRVRAEDSAFAGVRFAFECTGPRAVEVAIDSHPRAEALARALKDSGLECRLQATSRRTMALRVEPRVPAAVVFAPDIQRQIVLLELRNLPAIGMQRYPLEPERVDEDLLDAVAKLVLREPSELALLTDSVVDPDQREALRRRLEHEGRRRDAELAGGFRRAAFPVLEWLRQRFTGG